VPAVEVEKLGGDAQTTGSESEKIRQQVVAARKIQEDRLAECKLYTNSQMRNKEIKQYCKLDKEVEQLLRFATEKFDLSARAYFRIIKVARTIADLEGVEKIAVKHMAEAMQYRQVS
jgi:magnesium chelatase family protein